MFETLKFDCTMLRNLDRTTSARLILVSIRCIVTGFEVLNICTQARDVTLEERGSPISFIVYYERIVYGTSRLTLLCFLAIVSKMNIILHAKFNCSFFISFFFSCISFFFAKKAFNVPLKCRFSY